MQALRLDTLPQTTCQRADSRGLATSDSAVQPSMCLPMHRLPVIKSTTLLMTMMMPPQLTVPLRALMGIARSVPQVALCFAEKVTYGLQTVHAMLCLLAIHIFGDGLHSDCGQQCCYDQLARSSDTAYMSWTKDPHGRPYSISRSGSGSEDSREQQRSSGRQDASDIDDFEVPDNAPSPEVSLAVCLVD